MESSSAQRIDQQLVESMEAELLLQQKSILDFLKQPHTAADTSKYMDAVFESEQKINDVLWEIRKPREVESDFQTASSEICDQLKELKTYTRDMKTNLAISLYSDYRTDDKSSVDYTRNTGIFASIIGVGVTVWRSGNDTGNLWGAFWGVMAAVAALYSKKIIKGFGIAAKAACQPAKTTQDIKKYASIAKQRIDVFANEKTVKEKREKLSAAFSHAAKSGNQRITKIVGGAKKTIQRIRNKTPKL